MSQDYLPTRREPTDVVEEKGVKCLNCGRVFDREKIFCPVCGLRCGEDAKLPAQAGLISPGLEVATRSSRIFAILSLVLGIAGPLALGIGWLLAIIFGFAALNIIRVRGGFSRDRKTAIYGVSLGFMWPVVIGLLIFLLSYRMSTHKSIARNESSVINEVQNIAVTQKYVKSGHFFDRDNDGESEYGDFKDLSGVDYLYYEAGGTPGEQYGYSVQMEVVKEKSFRIYARPLIYGVTGKRSFFVDESGILRGGDFFRGTESLKKWETLPRVASESIFGNFDDEIAKDLFNLSKTLAREREFERVRKILAEIKRNYYMSPAASDLKLVTQSMDAYIMEDEAKESYHKALELMEEGKPRKSLTILKEIEKIYPDVLIISDVRKEREEVEKALSEELEKEAKVLFKQGEELELQRKYEEAISKYGKIASELDSTSYFPRVGKLIPLLEKKRDNLKAEAVFAQLSDFKPQENHGEILAGISVLMEHYAETDTVKNKKDYLSLLRTDCLGHKAKKMALDEFKKENLLAAVQAGEEALNTSPALEGDLKTILEASYMKLAESYFKNKEFDKAVKNYEKGMELSSEERLAEQEHYTESLYQLGKSAYLTGDYKMASHNLGRAKGYMNERHEYWYLLGSISAAQNEYEVADKYFMRAINLNGGYFNARYKRGLCRLSITQESEEELSKLLQNLNSLKRGMNIVIESAIVVNDLSAKNIDLGLETNPRILEGKTELTADQIRKKKLVPAERIKFLTETRAKVQSVETEYEKNEMLREKVKSQLKKISVEMSVAYEDLKNASESGALSFPEELLSLVRSKTEYFRAGHNRFESGLSLEGQIEAKAISELRAALSSFRNVQSVEKYAEKIDSLHQPFWKAQMEKKLTEATEFTGKAMQLKIPAGSYLSELK